jgi:hypothetical protein
VGVDVSFDELGTAAKVLGCLFPSVASGSRRSSVDALWIATSSNVSRSDCCPFFASLR